MPRDPRKLLHDIVTAAATISRFSRNSSLQDYDVDDMLRSACERQFEIIGEAMTRLRDGHPAAFARVPGGQSIIAFRNRLIHGYDTVDSEIVWDVIQRKLPPLQRAAEQLLEGKE